MRNAKTKKEDILEVNFKYDVKNDIWIFSQNKDSTRMVRAIIPDNITIGGIQVFKMMVTKKKRG